MGCGACSNFIYPGAAAQAEARQHLQSAIEAVDEELLRQAVAEATNVRVKHHINTILEEEMTALEMFGKILHAKTAEPLKAAMEDRKVEKLREAFRNSAGALEEVKTYEISGYLGYSELEAWSREVAEADAALHAEERKIAARQTLELLMNRVVEDPDDEGYDAFLAEVMAAHTEGQSAGLEENELAAAKAYIEAAVERAREGLQRALEADDLEMLKKAITKAEAVQLEDELPDAYAACVKLERAQALEKVREHQEAEKLQPLLEAIEECVLLGVPDEDLEEARAVAHGLKIAAALVAVSESCAEVQVLLERADGDEDPADIVLLLEVSKQDLERKIGAAKDLGATEEDLGSTHEVLSKLDTVWAAMQLDVLIENPVLAELEEAITYGQEHGVDQAKLEEATAVLHKCKEDRLRKKLKGLLDESKTNERTRLKELDEGEDPAVVVEGLETRRVRSLQLAEQLGEFFEEVEASQGMLETEKDTFLLDRAQHVKEHEVQKAEAWPQLQEALRTLGPDPEALTKALAACQEANCMRIEMEAAHAILTRRRMQMDLDKYEEMKSKDYFVTPKHPHLTVRCQNEHEMLHDAFNLEAWICERCGAESELTRLERIQCYACSYSICSYCYKRAQQEVQEMVANSNNQFFEEDENQGPALDEDEDSQRRWFRFWDLDRTTYLNKGEMQEAMKDSFPEAYAAVNEWIRMNWLDEYGEKLSEDEFINLGLGRKLAMELHAVESGTHAPRLMQTGGMLSRSAWFEHYDSDKDDQLSKGEVVDALLQDQRWRWGRDGAEDALRYIWPGSLDAGVQKREFILHQGLAEKMAKLLESELNSVDDWIFQNFTSEWEGKACGICMCDVTAEDQAQSFSCGCWMHVDCAGMALAVLINERRVNDENLSQCPAGCGKPLDRPIPPGAVRRCVDETLFAKFCENRLQIEWKAEAKKKGYLVAECPECRYIAICEDEDALLNVRCMRPTCNINRFCGVCGDDVHKGKTCEEFQKSKSDQNEADKALAELQEMGFQRCPRCGNAAELQSGCKWMMCSCNAKFCFHCGRDLPHEQQHYHHWFEGEGPFGNKCVGGKVDSQGQLGVCMKMGVVVPPEDCPDCPGWSYGKTECTKCKYWQFDEVPKEEG